MNSEKIKAVRVLIAALFNCRSLQLAVFNFALVNVALADTVTIEGVTLLCNSCSIIENHKKDDAEDLCQIRFFVEGRTLSCIDGLRELLEQTVRSGSITPPPTIAELRRFLLQPTRPKELARPVFSLMARQESGERALISEAGLFAERYPEVLSELFAAGEGGPNLLKTFWQIPKSEGIPLDPALRAAVALRIPEVQFEDLISDLSIADVPLDAMALLTFSNILQKSRPEWAAAATQLRSQVLECGAAAINGESNKECRPATTQPASAKYLLKVQASQTLSGLLSSKPPPDEVIARMEQLDLEHFRTPDAHTVIFSLITELIAGTEADAAKFLTPARRRMFHGFAESDRAIGEKYAELLTRRAVKVWQEGNDKEALELTQESYNVWPAEIVSRSELLGDLKNSPSLIKDEGAKEILAALGHSSSRIGSIFSAKLLQKFGSIVFSILGIVLIILVVQNLLGRLRRRGASESVEWKEQQMQKEIAELRTLLRDFNVGLKPSARELANSYRKMAKETHPDKNPAAGKKFSELSAKYKRAKELHQRYYRNL